ncbi:low temperature requirement protein A [Micromonospora sp. WMMD718]|uniref:low temperature requirement protein A n=1 Tax=unclassified Micromonospora TaxID=2617518 RepID=UPI00069DA6F7|nr:MULTISPECIES: low temperature requirement protein A [unclassified Micromonospora]MDG4752585.1 low temperature requirement protein A [Micromonospora sp. WMMD718]
MTLPELFLDLVFVYAFINVTDVMAKGSTIGALLQGGVMVLLLWRSWAGWAWVGNLVRLDSGRLPVAVFAAATAILLVAITIPKVFVDRSGGLFGPLVFALGFLAARTGSLLVISRAERGFGSSPTAVRRAWLPLAGSAPVLLCAALLPYRLPDTTRAEDLQLALFAVAIVIDYLGLRATGTERWQLTSAKHWAERHNTIMLIALGETIISIGTSRGFSGDPPITWSVLAGSGLGLVVVAFLWWVYFDIAAPDAEHALEHTSSNARSHFARDAYTLLHLPMIAGLILMAFGLKKALSATPPEAAVHWAGTYHSALYCGVALYLLGFVAFEWRTVRRAGRGPVLALVLVALLLPVTRHLTALGSLAVLAGVLVGVVLVQVTLLGRRHRQLHSVVAAIAGREVGASPEELFLDLVFVYGFIQVTVLMTRHQSLVGVLQGTAVLALLWASWVNYTWLTTMIPRAGTALRLVVLAAVALTLMLSIATPQAFSYVPGGLPAPLIVVTSYVAVRLLHLVSLCLAIRRDDLRAAVLRVAIPVGLATALLLCAILAAPTSGDPLTPLTTVCWLAAILVDLGGGYLLGVRSWKVRSVSRLTGRYNLIILIALGQAIIAIGTTIGELPLSVVNLLAVVLTAGLLSALWWTYVGTDIALTERLSALPTTGRYALVRDAYTSLHLFLVAGLVLMASGLRTVFLQPGHPDGAAGTFGRIALVCGLATYLLANQLVWFRSRCPVRRRQALNLAVALLAPATVLLPTLWALVVLTLALVLTHAFAGNGTFRRWR